MKNSTRKILKVIISIIYIVWGIYSPISAIKAIIALDVGSIISAAVGVLTLLAGIFGLLGIKRGKCRFFGIIILIASILSIIYTLPTGGVQINSVINAILAWFFISCV